VIATNTVPQSEVQFDVGAGGPPLTADMPPPPPPHAVRINAQANAPKRDIALRKREIVIMGIP
jgi:hypothetical protein